MDEEADLEEIKSDRAEEEEKHGVQQEDNEEDDDDSDDDEESKDTVGETDATLNSESVAASMSNPPAKDQLYLSASVREQELDKDFFTHESA